MEDHAASRWAIETLSALTRSTSSSQAIFDQLETCSSARDVSTASCPQSGKLDILVRTSNVKRLSDFMMWQVGAQERAKLTAVQRRHPAPLCQDLLARVWPDRHAANTVRLATKSVAQVCRLVERCMHVQGIYISCTLSQSHRPSSGPSFHLRFRLVQSHSNLSFPSFSLTSLCRSHSQRLSASLPLTSGGFSLTFSWKSSAQGTQGYSSDSDDSRLSMLR